MNSKNEKFKNMRRGVAVAAVLLSLAVAVFAVQTPITAVTPLGPYPGTVTAGQLNVTFTAADTSNGNSVILTGHEVLLACNTDSAAHTFTITSVADQYGRTSDITSYSLGAASGGLPTCAAFSFLSGFAGWRQTDNTVHLSANSALIYFLPLYVSR